MCDSRRMPSPKASIALSADTFIASLRILVNLATYDRMDSSDFWRHRRRSSIPAGRLYVAWMFLTKTSIRYAHDLMEPAGRVLNQARAVSFRYSWKYCMVAISF